MFRKSTQKFSGMYRGKVLDNIDSDKLGRLKIQVFGVFDGIVAADIPWAVPAFPLFSGSGNGYGSFAVPEIDSYVWVFFEVGDLYQPVYFAEAPSAIHGIPSEAAINYPYRKIWKTKAGVVIMVDDATGDVIIDSTGAAGDIGISGVAITITGTTIDIVSSGVVNISGSSVNINP